MRVLDIGCGMGDVSILVARHVGPGGRVVSIDLDQASIKTAEKRTSAVGFDNTTYHRSDILTFMDDEPFDAIVGRLVLEFLPDPNRPCCDPFSRHFLACAAACSASCPRAPRKMARASNFVSFAKVGAGIGCARWQPSGRTPVWNVILICLVVQLPRLLSLLGVKFAP